MEEDKNMELKDLTTLMDSCSMKTYFKITIYKLKASPLDSGHIYTHIFMPTHAHLQNKKTAKQIKHSL